MTGLGRRTGWAFPAQRPAVAPLSRKGRAAVCSDWARETMSRRAKEKDNPGSTGKAGRSHSPAGAPPCGVCWPWGRCRSGSAAAGGRAGTVVRCWQREAVTYAKPRLHRAACHAQRSRRGRVHLALASFHRADVLLTWNCLHLANPNKMQHIRLVNYELGLPMPALTTPLNYVGGGPSDG